jgi:V/A-type H+-transporting ATPase subunit G/H
MPGFELVQDLADLDRDLSEKVAEARRSADQKIKDAQVEAKHLLSEAEAQIRGLQEQAQKQNAEENVRLLEAAGKRAEEEKERLRAQALPNLPSAVKFMLLRILP